ncbi:MAG: DUF2029 domain-containing protein [Chloroflexi bacterium]|nr:MAG: DUF2029 domain-containing protein [Chloroflexota bacterium]
MRRWYGVRRLYEPRFRERTLLTLLAIAVAYYAWWSVQQWLTLDANALRFDFVNYFNGAHAALSGGDIYADFDRLWGTQAWTVAYIYPPFFALVLAPLMSLGLVTAGRVWLILIQLTFAADLWLILRISPELSKSARRIFLLAAFVFMPVYLNLKFQQVATLWLLLLTATLWAGLRRLPESGAHISDPALRPAPPLEHRGLRQRLFDRDHRHQPGALPQQRGVLHRCPPPDRAGELQLGQRLDHRTGEPVRGLLSLSLRRQHRLSRKGADPGRGRGHPRPHAVVGPRTGRPLGAPAGYGGARDRTPDGLQRDLAASPGCPAASHGHRHGLDPGAPARCPLRLVAGCRLRALLAGPQSLSAPERPGRAFERAGAAGPGRDLDQAGRADADLGAFPPDASPGTSDCAQAAAGNG